MRISTRVPDLQALDLLLSVVELGSLGRAALAHGISQPSASSRIRYLERLVGAPVLRRSSLGSAPTAAGDMITVLARDVIEAAQRLDAGIARVRADRDGHLQVAASHTIMEYLFPKWLKELRAQSPQTAVTLAACNSSDVGAAVAAGRADLGFMESPSRPSDLDSTTVARDELLVVTAPEHPWARRTTITVEELAAETLLHREAGSGARIAFERALRKHLPDWQPDAWFELSSTAAIKSAAVSGLAPAVLSSLAVTQELRTRSLTTVTVSGLSIHRSLRAVWPVGQNLTGPARQLCAIALRAGLAR
ncbi:LysR family transcriptional regulator [Streptomyces hydrogenans]|uniref:Transcriptional regulator n=1 Tax=Streptomyces hydrogenans TaxID=1873719 RepID=A0ABQ3PQF5_9ACTN|nr:LysR family transcriptional regulator [Streptomyces hydrogenans]GHE25525.1 transcriptional regulator [Streptomyces hydrogenans]GHI27248.1 transcriptional regulator [Streptomyces hydrogenans]